MEDSHKNVQNANIPARNAGKKNYWRAFWVLLILVIGLILLLPMRIITTEQGYPAIWFLVYAGVAISAFVFLGGLIMKKRFLPAVPPPFVRVDEVDHPLPGDVKVDLPPEDRELLYSVKELMDWFEEGKIKEARVHDYRARVAELERWFRTGIEKDIEIRNLRKELKKLKEELEKERLSHNEGGETSWKGLGDSEKLP